MTVTEYDDYHERHWLAALAGANAPENARMRGVLLTMAEDHLNRAAARLARPGDQSDPLEAAFALPAHT